MLPRKFLFIMPVPSALLLAYLIDIGSKVRAEERTEGWFYCKVDRIQKEINMNKKQTKDALVKIVSRGFIEVESRGIPSLRYFRVNYVKLHEAVSKLRFLDPDEGVGEFIEDEMD